MTLDAVTVGSLGAVTWSGGDITVNHGTVFDNDGTFNIACHQYFRLSGTFNNHGTLTKALAGGVTRFTIPFNNISVPLLPDAQVNVTGGEVDFNAGGEDNAPFMTGANGAIGFAGGSHTLEQGADFLGAGMVRVPSIAELHIATTNPATTITCNSTFLLGTDGQNPGELTGPGTFLVNGTFQWRGGEIRDSLLLTVSGTMDIGGTDPQVAVSSSITLQGNTTWAGANNMELTDTAITNLGQFEIQNDRMITRAPMDTSLFTNAAGTIIKTVSPIGPTQTTINVPFQQAGGNLDLNQRRISFQGGITQTAAGSTTYLDYGILIVAGTFTVTAGKVTGFGIISGNLTLDGGTLDTTTEAGTGQVTVTGDYEQTGTSTLKLKVGNRGGTIGPVYDQLLVLGNATLAGTLTIVQLAGFPAKPKDSFLVLDIWGTGTLAGTFGTPPDPTTWDISYVGGVTVTRK